MTDKAKLPYYLGLRWFEQQGKIPHRENIYGSGPPADVVSEEMLDFVIENAGRTILDVGCGIGAYIKRLEEKEFECVGIENNLEYVRIAKERGLDVRKMDARKLAFADRSFDTVIMIEVLEHVLEVDKVLSEVKRVTRKNFIVSVPNIGVLPYMAKYNVAPWHILEATHVNFFTKKILENTLRKYFRKVLVEEYGRFALWIEEKELFYHLRAIATKV